MDEQNLDDVVELLDKNNKSLESIYEHIMDLNHRDEVEKENKSYFRNLTDEDIRKIKLALRKETPDKFEIQKAVKRGVLRAITEVIWQIFLFGALSALVYLALTALATL